MLIGAYYAGLFGLATGDTKNIKIKSGFVSGYEAGGIRARVQYGSGNVTNCENHATIVAEKYGGGLIGFIGSVQLWTVEGCTNYGKVSGNYAGGIAGYCYCRKSYLNSAMINCLNQGIITSKNTSYSELLGYFDPD